MKKEVYIWLIGFFLFSFSFSFISSAPPFIDSIDFDDGYRLVTSEIYYLKVSEPHQFNFFVYNKSDGTLQDNATITCTFYLANSSGEILIFSDVPYFADGHWGIDILSGNFSYIGVYAYGLKCEDGFGGSMTGTLETTYTGKELDIFTIVIHLSLIILFILFSGIFYYTSNKTDFDKWNESIFKKYQNRNYIKLVLSTLGYHILKNSFVIYYLLGLPILLLFLNLVYFYDLQSLFVIVNTFLVLYFVGIILVGLIFLGYVQEWFMDLLEKVRNMKWGIE